MLTDGRTTDAGVTGILIAHLGAFGSGELKKHEMALNYKPSNELKINKAINPCFFFRFQWQKHVRIAYYLVNHGHKIKRNSIHGH